jgi:hypothetical protein
MEGLETMPMIGATQLQPYRERVDCRCVQCGANVNWFDKLKAWLTSGAMSVVNQRYCAGGKEPTESVGLVEALHRGSGEKLNTCAGVTEPHLHLTCRSCSFEWLMQVKGAKRHE